MGNIQNNVNASIGTMGAMAAMATHLADQEANRKADVAEAKNALESNLNQYKFDTVEAAAAISAHEPEFAEQIKDYDLKNLKDDQVQELAKKVEDFRAGKLTRDRIDRIEKVKDKIDIVNDLAKKDKTVDDIKATNQRLGELNTELGKAYEAERELNQRIEASRKLKFNIDSARDRIQERATSREKKEMGGIL